MFGFFLWIAVAHAAVVSNTTTPVVAESPPPTTVVTATPGASPSPDIPVSTPWTFRFSEFLTVAATQSFLLYTSPRPLVTTPLTRQFPTMFPIWALSRKPEIPFLGLASPYANSYAAQRYYTHANATAAAECGRSLESSKASWVATAPIGISTIYSASTRIWIDSGWSGSSVKSWVDISSTVTSRDTVWKVYSAVPTIFTIPDATITDRYAPFTLWTYSTPFTWSATGSCCWTCTIVGGTHVQVNYWPKTQAPIPINSTTSTAIGNGVNLRAIVPRNQTEAISTFVNSHGFTL